MISAPHIDARQTPRLARLQAIFDAKHRLARAPAGRALAAFGPGWAADFEEVLSTLCPDDMSLDSGCASTARSLSRSTSMNKAPGCSAAIAPANVVLPT